MLNTILLYIWNNKLLMVAMKNILSGEDKETLDEFKSHFIQQIIDTDINKLVSLYNKRELDWFCIRVMTNQYRSYTSSYYKEYKNRGKSGDKIIFSIIDDYDESIIDDHKPYIDRPDPNDIIKEIKMLLDTQYKNHLINHYHKTLFEMYYFSNMKLKDITKLTTINKDAISRSVRKTKEYIKTNTTYDINDY